MSSRSAAACQGAGTVPASAELASARAATVAAMKASSPCSLRAEVGSCEELVEAGGKHLAVGSRRVTGRKLNRSSVESFEQIEHRPVVLLEQPPADLHLVVRRHTHEVLIEGAVVDAAEAEAVPGGGLATRVRVPDDVRCIQKSSLLETADRAALPICRDDDRAKPALVTGLIKTRRSAGMSSFTKYG
jgi:hypothetical protein